MMIADMEAVTAAAMDAGILLVVVMDQAIHSSSILDFNTITIKTLDQETR